MALLKDGQIHYDAGVPDLTLANDQNTAGLDLNGVRSIALHFPSFADGRAFSQARQLRRRGFGGEIRATGQVTPDQYAFMIQCGFDVFDVDLEKASLASWQELAASMKLTYQRGFDTPQQQSIHALRQKAERQP